jgi:hypothetical protein
MLMAQLPGPCGAGRLIPARAPGPLPTNPKETTMLKTRITDRFGLSTPILNAGMAMVAGPELAAAVSNAGGLGMLGGAMVPPDGLRAMCAATRALTSRPFGVDLIGDFLADEHLDALIEERVPLVVFFWTIPPKEQIARLTASAPKSGRRSAPSPRRRTPSRRVSPGSSFRAPRRAGTPGRRHRP